MAEFVRAQIFGTTFEITSRSEPTGYMIRKQLINLDILIYNLLGWALLVWSGRNQS
jgi:hypothetical protein